MAECQLPKLDVAGSNPVGRSINPGGYGETRSPLGFSNNIETPRQGSEILNIHAYHDQPFADQSNGFDGLATSLKVNGPFGVKMRELLARGAKEGWFTYGGWLNKAEALITAGKFTWAIGLLPRLVGFPQGNSIIDGGTLWVMKGAKPEESGGRRAVPQNTSPPPRTRRGGGGDGISAARQRRRQVQVGDPRG